MHVTVHYVHVASYVLCVCVCFILLNMDRLARLPSNILACKKLNFKNDQYFLKYHYVHLKIKHLRYLYRVGFQSGKIRSRIFYFFITFCQEAFRRFQLDVNMSGLRQTPLTCSGHTRPVVQLAFSDITPFGYFLISACKGMTFQFWPLFLQMLKQYGRNRVFRISSISISEFTAYSLQLNAF